MEAHLTPEQELDISLYGQTFIDANGKRIDPLTVRVGGSNE